MNKKSYKNPILVEEFLSDAAQNKTLRLNLGKDSKEYNILAHLSLMILSQKISGVKVLDIRKTPQNIYNFAFLELLKNFKTLEKIKIKIDVLANYDMLFKLLETVVLFLENISCIKLDLEEIKTFDLMKGVETDKIFNDSMLPKTLKKLKLKKCNLIMNSCIKNTILKDFIVNSKLVCLDISSVYLDFDTVFQLVKGLEENQTISCLRLRKIKLLGKNVKGCGSNNKKLETFIMILTSLKNMKHYEKISLYYPENDLDKYDIPDDASELYLDIINNLLKSNQKLKEFNVFLEIPNKFHFKYNNILINAFRANKELKIINFIDLKELISDDKKAYDLAYDYYCKNNLKFPKSKNFINRKPQTYKLMSIMISEIIKEFNPLVVSKLINVLFGENSYLNNKTLNLINPK